MKAINAVSAIIFDMDGLVLDTEPGYFAAWKMAAERMGFVLTDAFLHTLSGLPFQAVEAALQRQCGDSFNRKNFARYSTEYWWQSVRQQGIPVKPGVTALLARIQQRQIPYCLATNSHSRNARQCLELAGLSGAFDRIIGHEQVRAAKPAPDIFLHAAACMAVDIQTCLVLEDSEKGITAARRAGAYSVLIPSFDANTLKTASQATWTMQSLTELTVRLNQSGII